MSDDEREVFKMVQKLGDLDNQTFIDFVRRMEKKNESWVTSEVWRSAVDREVRFRMLLK